MKKRWLAVLLGSTVAVLPLQAQSVVLSGKVVNGDGEPVPAARITVNRFAAVLAADSGEFRLQLESPRRVTMNVQRLGYMPARLLLDVKRDTVVEVILLPAAQRLAPQAIMARRLDRVGFFSRMREAEVGILTGTFITADEIEKRKPSKISDMFMKAAGVKLKHVEGVGAVLVSAEGACQMVVYLDGVRVTLDGGHAARNGVNRHGELKGQDAIDQVNPSRRIHGGQGMPWVSIDDIVTPGSVLGIEIYPRPTRAPPQFQQLNAGCGVMAVWTKMGLDRQLKEAQQ